MNEPRRRRLGWGTWSPDRPAELMHPELGIRLTPVLYAASANAVSLLAPRETRLGLRSMDGREARLRSEFHGTVLDWRFRFDSDGVEIEWRTRRTGEWGLRFWVVLVASGGDGWRFDEAGGELRAAESGELRAAESGELRAAESGELRAAVQVAESAELWIRAANAPLLTTFHAHLDALCDEFVDKGYFYLGSRGTSGTCAALRFNLEEAPRQRIVCRLGEIETPELTRDDWTLADEHPAGSPQQALQAINDVMRWNHVYDAINRRPYTGLTRFWSARKFSGFGIWLDDVAFNAWLWGHIDLQGARDNLAAIFAFQTEAGNFPCLVTGNDAWIDRTQLPILGYVVWNLYQRSGDESLIRWAFPKLLANFDWWWRERELGGAGLVAYGTTPGVGRGLYRGTKLGAKNESAMDNSPVHDDAPFDSETGLLQAFDVGANSLLALDNEMLIEMAGLLGDVDTAARLRVRHADHVERIRDRLWDAERGVFANRLRSGDFVRQLAPTSFYPLVAGVATAAQAASLIDNYLLPPEKFGGEIGLPSVARDDPSYRDNVYWRGRVWPTLNFWTLRGLQRAGFHAHAQALADNSWRLFQSGWQERLCGENFHAETGEITDQPDTDTFYSWGVLMAAMSLVGPDDIQPWDAGNGSEPSDT
ncbi:MGH1-like glycoside hydrolase domain-containing protein [Salinicola peritrichatus]|uniref:MGH1-like glycoside hydrolase domain-containing protein n=1 Tax=Salinicola peritrichatus TaxID=1267424 RepID=UPI000DA1FE76|nr:trehalase family glycosidase [Salinicola peritrichatus]